MTDFAKQTDNDDPQLAKDAIENLKWGCRFVLYGCAEESIEEIRIGLAKFLKFGNK